MTADLLSQIECKEFKTFCQKTRDAKFFYSKYLYHNEPLILDHIAISKLIQLSDVEQDFFLNVVDSEQLNVNLEITTADKLYFNRKCKSSSKILSFTTN